MTRFTVFLIGCILLLPSCAAHYQYKTDFAIEQRKAIEAEVELEKLRSLQPIASVRTKAGDSFTVYSQNQNRVAKIEEAESIADGIKKVVVTPTVAGASAIVAAGIAFKDAKTVDTGGGNYTETHETPITSTDNSVSGEVTNTDRHDTAVTDRHDVSQIPIE